MTEFVFGASEVGFHRAERPVRHRGDFGMGEALLIEKMQGGLLIRIELFHGGAEIFLQVDGAGRRREIFRRHRKVRRLPGNLALTAAGVAPVIVGDAEQPGGKSRLAAEARQPAVGLEERFLGEVVGQRGIAAREMAEKKAHGRLMAKDKFSERRAVAGGNRAGDEFGIGRGHFLSEASRLF